MVSSPIENQLIRVNVIFFQIFPLKYLNLVLIPGAKLNDRRDEQDLNMITDAFLVEKWGTLERARRLVFKNLLAKFMLSR